MSRKYLKKLTIEELNGALAKAIKVRNTELFLKITRVMDERGVPVAI